MKLIGVSSGTGWVVAGRRGLLLAGFALAGLLLGAYAWGVPMASGDTGSGPLGVKGLSEKKLRAAETEILGRGHAAEHAGLRAIAREGGAGSPATGENSQRTAQANARLVGTPAQVGQWDAPFTIPIPGTNAVMLPTGKVMWWAYPNGPVRTNTAQAWLWDPATGTNTRVDPPLWLDPADGQMKPANIWCSGQSLLADGRVLVTGGNLAYPSTGNPGFSGLNKVYTFNPFNETWTEQPDMPHGRWYPSQKLLPDGRTLIMSGDDETGQNVANHDVEVFTPSADMNGVGTLQTIGHRGGTGEPPDGEWYPHTFVMPSGRTLVAGPDPVDTWSYDTIGSTSFTWSDRLNLSQSRLWGSGVHDPADPNKITLLGGSDYSASLPTSTTVTYDEANPSLNWQAGPSLNVARAHLNTVLLPDGGMATVGGGYGKGTDVQGGLWYAGTEHKQIELFDPVTQTWQLGASQVEARAYHSTALLLPDGRLISAGATDFFKTEGRDTAEIYSPPYLFHGPRPKIDFVPESVGWGDEFGVYSTSSGISRAVLMAPSAVTHANDMNQRRVELQVVNNFSGDGINVRAPANARLAQPGYYMLFLLNDQGVPSVSRWIRLDPSAPARSLVSDTIPPNTVIASKKIKGTTARFRFRSNELRSTFRCKLDRRPFKPCSTPKTYKKLKRGKHTFKVRATDGAGNTDPTPARSRFKIKGG